MLIRSRLAAIAACVMLGASALAHDTSVWMVAYMTGSQEVPATNSAGFGVGYFRIDKATNKMTYRIAYQGLSANETVTNFHGPADPGVDGLPIDTFPAGRVKSGSYIYPQEIESDLLAGRCYVNVHTTAFPDGEIRGQMVHAVALIDGAQAVPGNGSTAKGIGLFMIDDVNNSVSYYIKTNAASEVTSEIGGFAVHGLTGSVVHSLASGDVKTGSFSYSEDDQQRIVDGMLYVNVRTTPFPSGEIRGQIVGSCGPLDGKQENPQNNSSAVGWGLVSIDRDANLLGYDVGFVGLGSAETMAHIHGYTLEGFNAGVRFTLPLGSRKVGRWTYPEADESSILKNFAYFNVHSNNFPNGEIRGQIKFPVERFCPGDFNDDGFVTGDDFDEFVEVFELGLPGADVNFDGFVTGDDFDKYVASFEGGC